MTIKVPVRNDKIPQGCIGGFHGLDGVSNRAHEIRVAGGDWKPPEYTWQWVTSRQHGSLEPQGRELVARLLLLVAIRRRDVLSRRRSGESELLNVVDAVIPESKIQQSILAIDILYQILPIEFRLFQHENAQIHEEFLTLHSVFMNMSITSLTKL